MNVVFLQRSYTDNDKTEWYLITESHSTGRFHDSVAQVLFLFKLIFVPDEYWDICKSMVRLTVCMNNMQIYGLETWVR